MELDHIRWIRSGTPDVDTTLSHAGRELARYVRKLCDQRPDVRGVKRVRKAPHTAWLSVCDQMPESPTGALQPALWDDGFALWADGNTLFIAGRNARSVLFGVYAFLETQGVRFLRPGRDGEVIPQVEALVPPEGVLVEEPRYRHRGVCIEGAPSIQQALGMVDWCAKKRMNTVFLQFLSSRYFYNQWSERAYNPKYAGPSLTEQEALALDDQVIAAMKQRGMVFHRVGHGWTSAAFGMRRSGWVTAGEEVPPEYVRWLAEVDGERALYKDIPINTELCYSHGPAFEAFVENIVRYCEQHPEMDVVHVWLSDATNNKCECEECRQLSISDWYAKVINALSAALHRRAPKTRFVFLCYIELLWAPEQVEIDERYGNAILMFAPISRCYGHALTDPACDDGEAWPRPLLNRFAVSRLNAFFVKALGDWREAFQGDSFDFDYHMMWDVWRHMTDTIVARVFYEDLQDLKEIGLDGIVSCQSFRAFYPSGLAMTAMAECLWNPDVAWPELRSRYLEAAYGEHAEFARRYLAQIEAFLDTGDPHWRQPPLSNASEAKLTACAAFLGRSLVQVKKIAATADRTHRRSLDLLGHHMRFLQFIVRAYQARLASKPEAESKAWDGAAAFLRRTEPRYSTYIDTMLSLRLAVEARREG